MRDGLGASVLQKGWEKWCFFSKGRDEGLEEEATRIKGWCRLEQVSWKVARIKEKWHCYDSTAVPLHVCGPLHISETSHKCSTLLTNAPASQLLVKVKKKKWLGLRHSWAELRVGGCHCRNPETICRSRFWNSAT